MFCSNCGHEIDDNAVFCPHCGVSTQQVSAPQPQTQTASQKNGIVIAAKVFIIIGMVFGCWMILPLIFGGLGLSALNKGKPSIGISVCVLIFCSLIGGILMLLVDEKL